MAFQHATRSLHVATELGDDTLELVRIEGEEELSRLFCFQLDLVSKSGAIAAEDIVGTNLTVSVEFGDGQQRFFNGLVQRFSAGEQNERGIRNYRAVVVPWLWFLTQTTDCRIFQDMSVIEIVEKIFQDLGFTDYQLRQLSGNHPKRNYCVQYRESDFDFVSRLLEEEGVFYFFQHTNGKHVMQLADSADAYLDCQESQVDYPNTELIHKAVRPHIQSWEHNYEFRSGKWAHTDYNFKKPSDRLMTNEKTLMKFRNANKFEQYDFPGEYRAKGYGADLARVRMEEIELDHDLVSGTSSCRTFGPGFRFKVGRHRSESEQGKAYVFKRVVHLAEEHTYESSSGLEPGIGYVNRFECFPAATNFRPARLTPKPIVRGCQTAVVTGPPGEEIYPDEHGRVKVQFHWDREGNFDDKSSCWVRVSQIHAGQGWGYMDIPRIGEEVIVDFMEGDPDQPIIVGRVYNGNNKPPFDLPAGKTRRGNTTKTYKGSGYNEMSMDDTPGKEQIRIHGQYNMDTVIEHNETHHVKNDRKKTIGNDETSDILNDQTITVHNDRKKVVVNNETTEIGVDRTETVGNDESVTVVNNRNVLVGNNDNKQVAANDDTLIGMNQSLSVGVNRTVNVGANASEAVGANLSSQVGASKSESVGASRSASVGLIDSASSGLITNLDAGLLMNLKAGVTLTLSGPGGTITIGPNGIHIKGNMVVIEGGTVHINP